MKPNLHFPRATCLLIACSGAFACSETSEGAVVNSDFAGDPDSSSDGEGAPTTTAAGDDSEAPDAPSEGGTPPGASPIGTSVGSPTPETTPDAGETGSSTPAADAGAASPTEPDAGSGESDGFPMLLVSVGSFGVLIFHNADELAADSTPQVALQTTMNGLVFATGSRDRLFTLDEDLSIFEDPKTITKFSVPSAQITAFSEAVSPSFGHLELDATGDLWVSYNSGFAALFKDAASLDSDSTPSFEAIGVPGSDQAGVHSISLGGSGRTFGTRYGLFSGLYVLENLNTASGIVEWPMPLSDFEARDSAIDEDVLYTTGPDGLAKWEGTAFLGPGSTPTIVSPDPGSSIAVASGALARTREDRSTGNLVHHVEYYADAAALTTGSEPVSWTNGRQIPRIMLTPDGDRVFASDSSEPRLVVLRPTPTALEEEFTIDLTSHLPDSARAIRPMSWIE